MVEFVGMADVDSISEADRETLRKLARETEYVVSVLWAERPGGGYGSVSQISTAAKTQAASVLVAAKHREEQTGG